MRIVETPNFTKVVPFKFREGRRLNNWLIDLYKSNYLFMQFFLSDNNFNHLYFPMLSNKGVEFYLEIDFPINNCVKIKYKELAKCINEYMSDSSLIETISFLISFYNSSKEERYCIYADLDDRDSYYDCIFGDKLCDKAKLAKNKLLGKFSSNNVLTKNFIASTIDKKSEASVNIVFASENSPFMLVDLSMFDEVYFKVVYCKNNARDYANELINSYNLYDIFVDCGVLLSDI